MPNQSIVVCLIHQSIKNLVKFYKQTRFLLPEIIYFTLELTIKLVKNQERLFNSFLILLYALRSQKFLQKVVEEFY